MLPGVGRVDDLSATVGVCLTRSSWLPERSASLARSCPVHRALAMVVAVRRVDQGRMLPDLGCYEERYRLTCSAALDLADPRPTALLYLHASNIGPRIG
jgi:hypothetical protein